MPFVASASLRLEQPYSRTTLLDLKAQIVAAVPSGITGRVAVSHDLSRLHLLLFAVKAEEVSKATKEVEEKVSKLGFKLHRLSLDNCQGSGYSRLKVDEVEPRCVRCMGAAEIQHDCSKVCAVCTCAVVVCAECMLAASLVFFCEAHQLLRTREAFQPFLLDFTKEQLLHQQHLLQVLLREELKPVELKHLRTEAWKHLHRIKQVLSLNAELKGSKVARCRSCGLPRSACSKMCFHVRLGLDEINGLKPDRKRKRSTSEDRVVKLKQPTVESNQPVYHYALEEAADGSPLRTVTPYLHKFETFAKRRWIGMELLDLFNTEFGANPPAYHAAAIALGLITVNGSTCAPSYKLKDGDAVAHLAHIHEPPVSYAAVEDLVVGETDDVLAINKPASMPVHPCGAYRANSLSVVLHSELPGGKGGELKPLHRIDRLTSGLVLFAKSKKAAKQIGRILMRVDADGKSGSVKKDYLARVHGRFPISSVELDKSHKLPTLSHDPSPDQRGVYFDEKEENVSVACPLRCVDHRQGEWECASEGGKPSKSRFKLLTYDEEKNASVILAQPLTGRTHQLRLHLRELGYPIVNDPNYGKEGNISQDRLRKETERSGLLEEQPIDIEGISQEEDIEERAKRICRYCTQHGAASAFKALQLRWQGICLHALKYEFQLPDGKTLCFETPYPAWASS